MQADLKLYCAWSQLPSRYPINRNLRELEAKGWIERLSGNGPGRVIRLCSPGAPTPSTACPGPEKGDYASLALFLSVCYGKANME